ncbi:hypothetical protein CTAYLR_002034 [Chrysophaeum taylorii]|uniref:PKD/REJ-like domain-containing protein n=1 Tax=Chrysophaeum taylorii TaxID=2483200 RepID=A0AAD7UMH5_9STRA|nr:hypothetical protein CTAYLR_002034 [Chrysophaeum taylorii]
MRALIWLATAVLAEEFECLGVIVDGSPFDDSGFSCSEDDRDDLDKPDVATADRATVSAGTRCCEDTADGIFTSKIYSYAARMKTNVEFVCPGVNGGGEDADVCEWVEFAVAKERCEDNGFRLCTQSEVLAGNLVNGTGCWEPARTHVLTHVVSYGAADVVAHPVAFAAAVVLAHAWTFAASYAPSNFRALNFADRAAVARAQSRPNKGGSDSDGRTLGRAHAASIACAIILGSVACSFALALHYYPPPSSEPTWILAENVTVEDLSCERYLDLIDRSPPSPFSAAFESSGAYVSVAFTEDVDISSYEGSVFACDEILTFRDSDVATCSFQSMRLLEAVVTSTNLVPGDAMTVLPGVIKSSCDDTLFRCECDAFAGEETIQVEAPPDPDEPRAVLSYPSTASHCETLEVDATKSEGSGGRDMVFEWFAEVDSVPVLAEAVERATDNPVFSVEPEELQVLTEATNPTTKLAVSVRLTNFLNGTSRSDDITIVLTSKLIPSVTVSSDRSFAVTRGETLDVSVYATASACEGRDDDADRGTTITKILVTGEARRRRLEEGVVDSSVAVSTSDDPRRFKLDPYTLDTGSNYSLTFVAHDSVLDLNTSETILIEVVSSDVEAIISGGDKMVTTAAAVNISAAESRDPDVSGLTGEAAGLRFSWSSSPSVAGAGLDDGETTTARFVEIGTYTISVLVSSSDGRNATASVEYVVVDPPGADGPLVDVSIEAESRVSNSERVVLEGSVALSETDDASTLVSTWSLASGVLSARSSLEDAATTQISVSNTASRRTRTHYLVLPAGSLVAGVAYNFRLDASVEENELGEILSEGFASVSIAAARVPAPGRVTVSPSEGIVLVTRFELQTSLWTTDDPPLKYSFKSIVDSEDARRLSPPSLSNEVVDALLPAGTPNVTIVAVAQDALGGEGEVATSARVEQSDLSSEDLATVVDELLADAFALHSLESLSQAVVAASGASNRNQEITGSLVSALAVGTATQDDDSSIVEQSSTALSSAASDSTLLDEASATTSLQVSGNLANLSLREGVTGSAAGALASTLSSVIGTSLFLADGPQRRRLDDNSTNSSSSSSSSSQLLGASFDAICRSQLVNAVQNENPQTLDVPNIKSSSSRFSQSSQDGSTRAVMVPSGAGAELPESLGDSDDGDYETWFAEFDANTHAADPGGDAATSESTLRFGLSGPSDSAVSVAFALSTNATSSTKNSTTNAGANLTCPCEFYGNVSHRCPDGTLLTYACEGVQATFEVFCPSVQDGCLSWDPVALEWTEDSCEVATGADGSLRCACEIQPSSEAVDISSSTSVTGALSAYSASLTAKPDLGAAFHILLTCGIIFALCCLMSIFSRRLDRRDQALLARGRTPPSGSFSFPSFSGFDETWSVSSSERQTDHSEEKDVDEENVVFPNPSQHEQQQQQQQQQRNLVVVARHDQLVKGSYSSRFVAAFKRTHPFVTWLFVFDPNATRTSRVWMGIGFEILIFFFALALGNNLYYPDPGCADDETEEDCLGHPKAAKWIPGGGHDMCEWHQCSQECTPYLPDDTGGEKPADLLAVVLVIFIVFPLLRLYGWLYDSYLGRRLPTKIDALWQEFCCGSTPQLGAPPASEELDGSISEPFSEVDLLSLQYRSQSTAGGGADDQSTTAPADASRSDSATMSQRLTQRIAVVMGRGRSAHKPPQLSHEGSVLMLQAVEEEDDEQIVESAVAAARSVADAVQAQSAELRELINELQKRRASSNNKASRARVLSFLGRLRDELHVKWGYDQHNREKFVDHVRERLEREMRLSLRWHRELRDLRGACKYDEEAYKRRARMLLLEFQHVERMTPLERRLYYASLDRVDAADAYDGDEEPPPCKAYVAAFVFILGSAAVFVWYLVQTASLIGRRRSRVWLVDAVVTLAIVYGIISPTAIFFFQVWIPSLLAGHIATLDPKKSKPFPYTQETPHAMTFLLAQHPELAEDPEIRFLGTSRESITSIDDVSAHAADYVNAELWKPPPDTRLLIVLLGNFSFLAEDVQSTIVEEIVVFTPVLSSLALSGTSISRQKGLGLAVSLILTYIILFLIYVVIETIRLAVRKVYRRITPDPTVQMLVW